jgi:hypothetical protein
MHEILVGAYPILLAEVKTSVVSHTLAPTPADPRSLGLKQLLQPANLRGELSIAS